MTTDQRLRALQQQSSEALRHGEDSARSPIGHRERSPEPTSRFSAAIDEVRWLTLVLTSRNAQLAFAEAARTRDELERALSRAQRLAETLAGASRAEALQRLHEMHSVATQLLAVAPMPSAAAIAAAEAGEDSALHREQQAWIAWRWASSYSLLVPRRSSSRRRRDTPLETPTALRRASGERGDTATPISGSALPAIASLSDFRQRRGRS
jgi:hypothetical protein